jgi:sugar O-acyltransferase (sialic acid O-acetyltransferase NeuD family)
MTPLKRVFIIGARPDGHGKVVLEILQAMGIFDVIGFVDDDPDKTDLSIRGLKVISTTAEMRSLRDKYQAVGGIVAIADNPARRKLGMLIEECGFELINAIHPTVHLDSDIILGRGIVLCQGVIVVAGTRIGNSVNIHTGATIDHDNIIEDGANLGPGVHTAGRVRVGKDAFIGTGAALIPNVTVGEGALIGAGTVVIRPVIPYDRVVGVPARSIKDH